MRQFPKSMLVLLIGLLWLTPLASAGAASRLEPTSQKTQLGSFVGTRAELVATVMPTLLQRAGYSPQMADARLVGDLKAKFQGSEAFMWSRTLVQTQGEIGFSFTFPSDVTLIRQGALVMGVVHNGTLVNAVFLQVTPLANGGMHLDVLSPDGNQLTSLTLKADAHGKFQIDRNALTGFAKVIIPESLSGIFDPIIVLLEQVLNALYMVRDLINIGICVVNTMIDLFENLNGCNWGTGGPGGGAVINKIICSVDAIVAFIDAVTSSCI